VRKINNVSRNIERLSFLQENGYRDPKILKIDDNILEMEYIHGMDMKSFLLHCQQEVLEDFIDSTLQSFSKNSQYKDYTDVYNNKLSWMDNDSQLPFTKQELIEKLPKRLPQSTYHGDFTLENLLYSSEFYMIDAVTIEYDSYVFDIAKLRQDLNCQWFLRNTDLRLSTKLRSIENKLLLKYPVANNDYLLILMLLRVYLHTEKGDDDFNFIMREIQRLWK
jgi:RIO-like serine/threonine protein kinase